MRLTLALAAILLVLTGCGSSEEAETQSSATSTPRAASETFPQTVEHKFGSTTVKAKPERIVIVGLTEQDTVLQLGYTPVATTEWYGEQPYAVWPWAQKLLGDAKPTV